MWKEQYVDKGNRESRYLFLRLFKCFIIEVFTKPFNHTKFKINNPSCDIIVQNWVEGNR